MFTSRVGLFVIFISSFGQYVQSVQKLRIGGIFDLDEEYEEFAFRVAVNMANTAHSNLSIRFVAETVLVPTTNTLAVSKAACQLLEDGVIAIFGPSSPYTSSYVQSLCDSKEVPHMETHWDKLQLNSLVNLYPNPDTLPKAYIDIIESWNWKTFTVIYENDGSLPKIIELFMLDRKKYVVHLKQLDLDAQFSYRTILNELKSSGETHFVLDCSTDILGDVLKQSQEVGIINEHYHFIITNLDMHTINLAPYQYAGCNITGVRIVNPERREVIKFAENIEKLRLKHGKDVQLVSHLSAWKVNVRSALLYDGVHVLIETVDDFEVSKPIEEKVLFCNGSDSWEHGYSIINNIKTRSFIGLTGLIKFDTLRFRNEFSLDVVELAAGGLTKIGTWNSTTGLNISRIYKESKRHNPEEYTLTNKSLTVITALTPPYGMLKETAIQLWGNDRFEGFGIDLIYELSLMLGFNYTFVIQEDGANGSFDRKTKQWNGMIREIIDGKADLAIGDLTITSERENAVDFTMPFMNLGISILYRKPEAEAPSLFSFASPFSFYVWLLLALAYFMVSMSLFVIGRLCPTEWTNPYPCVENPSTLINQFSLKNSFWFTIGSLMQQGTDIAPIGVATRTVAGVWWFFTLIMVSSYTANLAAFLTIETLVVPFKNVIGLANQKEIRYGAKVDGATSNFFRDSDIETYKTIWKHMYRHPEDMTSDNDEGVRKVESGNYAFLMESTTIEYMVERHCTLAQVGGLLDDKGYGIAMRKDTPYRHKLSAAVVKLSEIGRINELKIKWWKERRGGGICSNRRAGQATPLGLRNVEGVFLILVIGMFLGFVGTFVELGVHVWRSKKKDNSSFRSRYFKELKLILRFKKRTKPTMMQESPASSDYIIKERASSKPKI